MDDGTSQHESSVGWVNTPSGRNRSWDSDSLGDYLVMDISSRKNTVKVAGAKLPFKTNVRITSE